MAQNEDFGFTTTHPLPSQTLHRTKNTEDIASCLMNNQRRESAVMPSSQGTLEQH